MASPAYKHPAPTAKQQLQHALDHERRQRIINAPFRVVTHPCKTHGGCAIEKLGGAGAGRGNLVVHDRGIRD